MELKADEQKNDGQVAKADGAAKVEFSPEQQAKVQELIDTAYAKAFTKAEAARVNEINQLRTQLEAIKKTESKAEGKGEDVTALQERIAQLEKKSALSAERERRASLLAVAAEQNAINAEQVATLITPFVQVDEQGTRIVNAEGLVRLDASGKPMGMKEFVAEFLTSNPHLVKATGRPGAGSGVGKNKDGEIEALSKMSPVARINEARKANLK